MRRTTIAIAVQLALIAGAIVACGGGTDQDPTTQPAREASMNPATMPQDVVVTPGAQQ